MTIFPVLCVFASCVLVLQALSLPLGGSTESSVDDQGNVKNIKANSIF